MRDSIRDSIKAMISAVNKHSILIVGLLCIAIIILCSAYFVAALSQTRKESQEQQTPAIRPRKFNAPEVTVAQPADDAKGADDSKRAADKSKIAAAAKEEKRPDEQPTFLAVIERRGAKPENFCSLDNPVSRRVLEDYGAIYVASESVEMPPVCEFESDADVLKFQNTASFMSEVVGGVKIELQPAAMQALLQARTEAQGLGLDITPRGGSEAARRSYKDTLRLWNSRFIPALAYWNRRGRLSSEQVSRLRSLPLHKQVEEVLELEKGGIYFSKDLSKSILYSVAAPGTSQHISMLALDVAQYGNPRVRQILTKYGWFQTVKSDLPHFTYLGLEEKDLLSKGLHPVMVGAQRFWIPDFGASH
jgi:hypothetical protein